MKRPVMVAVDARKLIDLCHGLKRWPDWRKSMIQRKGG